MKAMDYVKRVISEKSAWVDLEFATEVRDALMAMGYRVCTGAGRWINGVEVVLYLD